MKRFLLFLLLLLAANSISVLLWLTCFIVFDQTFLLSSVYAAATWNLVYFGGKWYKTFLLRKENKLTRQEYRYIKQNLKEAKVKIVRLRKAIFSVKSLQTLKQNMDIYRMARKIYWLTKEEPNRFYQVERFYYQNLDLVVELTEKYALLASQPKRNPKLEMVLSETRLTIGELAKQLEKDLYDLLKTDIDHLQYELDVAKHSFKNAGEKIK
ncbi:5-bromo-4-chloroindolyl phosphate hydrolysis family protein [Bacillus sp. CLL-7-23]|uniref:5-bromo-4-chloroindolyl phosphate hydrolysis family protein n=1 Tax=Bacillus changyiensis TaxID=3004103 RepID=A0ABT4X8N1_9BACI|nr:5-bromo-4-chloroindolyl phosphate hydrolysis family protein [Bacillus changyiensis]MDA7028407.1 5-bromo-4-chloroindolyl phosphate hydrolysis family protein [Bacillus changyiensis]